MISVGNNKAVICKGDFHPAQLYKGDKKIAGYSVEDFESENGVTLENCYNDKLHNAQIFGNSIQDGTPTPEAPVEVQSVGELVTEGEYAGKYKIPVTARGKNLWKPQYFSAATIRGNSPVTENAYGTSINTTDASYNRVEITQKTVDTEASITSFLNGYICLYSSEKLKGGKGVLSFSYEITNNLLISNLINIAASTSAWVGCTLQSDKGRAYIALDIPEKCDYITIRLVGKSLILSDFMVESGALQSDFEPYIEPQTVNIYLDEPLRKVGDYADYVDFKKMVVVNRVGMTKVKDLSWSKQSDMSASDGTVLYRYECKNAKKRNFIAPYSTLGDLICDGLKNTAYNTTKLDKSISERTDHNSIGTGRQLRIFTSEYSTGSGMRTAFGEFDIYFILDEPYITEEPIELPELPTFKGTTIYEIATEIPATISGKYKKVEV